MIKTALTPRDEDFDDSEDDEEEEEDVDAPAATGDAPTVELDPEAINVDAVDVYSHFWSASRSVSDAVDSSPLYSSSAKPLSISDGLSFCSARGERPLCMTLGTWLPHSLYMHIHEAWVC